MASVEMPVEVRIGGAAVRARAWYARKINPYVSIRKRRASGIFPIIACAPELLEEWVLCHRRNASLDNMS